MLKKYKTEHMLPSQIKQKWFVVDAKGQTVGRLATRIATILKGKHRATYSPHVYFGDKVVVLNCDKVHFTGKKWSDKKYFWHSNYISGIKQRTADEQLTKHPELILKDAIQGMLPKTSLGRKQLKNLKLYCGDTHTHQAQTPEQLS